MRCSKQWAGLPKIAQQNVRTKGFILATTHTIFLICAHYVSCLKSFFTPVLLNCGPEPLLKNIPSPSPFSTLCTLNCLSFSTGVTNSLTTYTSDCFNFVCTGNRFRAMEVGGGLGRSRELVKVWTLCPRWTLSTRPLVSVSNIDLRVIGLLEIVLFARAMTKSIAKLRTGVNSCPKKQACDFVPIRGGLTQPQVFEILAFKVDPIF